MRKHVEKYILTLVNRLTNTKVNESIYKNAFKTMSDEDFKTWIESIISKKSKLAVYLPGDGTGADVAECKKFASEQGYSFHQRMVIPESSSVPEHMSLAEHLVYMLPIRRQTQTFSKKIGVAKDDKKVDVLTGQATGDSSPTTISAPENRILTGIGLKYTVRELNKIKGGDVGAYKAYKRLMIDHGTSSQQSIEGFATGTGAGRLLRSWLRGKHVDTNF